MFTNHYRFHLHKTSYQILIIFSLAITALTTGITPEINFTAKTISISNQVNAQTPTDATLKKYADAAMEIESLRKTTFDNIENILGKSKPNTLNCYQEESFNQLPENARSLAVNYCQQSEGIVKKHGLTINQFNQIHQQVRQNNEVNQRLQVIMKN